MGHQASTHCTLARWPFSVRSIQLASYSLGPIIEFSESIRLSSRTSVAVRPSFECAPTLSRMAWKELRRANRQVRPQAVAQSSMQGEALRNTP